MASKARRELELELKLNAGRAETGVSADRTEDDKAKRKRAQKRNRRKRKAKRMKNKASIQNSSTLAKPIIDTTVTTTSTTTETHSPPADIIQPHQPYEDSGDTLELKDFEPKSVEVAHHHQPSPRQMSAETSILSPPNRQIEEFHSNSDEFPTLQEANPLRAIRKVADVHRFHMFQ